MPQGIFFRRILLGFCIATGLLSWLAASLTLPFDAVAFAFLLPIYLFLLLIYFAPAFFVLGTAALIGNFLFRRLGNIGRLTATAAIMAIPLSLACLASTYVNRPLDRQWQALAAGDRQWSGSIAGTRRLAVLGYATWCAPICQHLLYNGAVQVVNIGASPRNHGDAELDLTQAVTSYRVERRASCPLVSGRLEREIQSRIDAGDCLISEPATLADSDLVVIDNFLKNPEKLWDTDPRRLWQLAPDTLTTRRLSVHTIQDGRAREVFRQTELHAEPVSTPFLAGPVGIDEEIHLGILRVARSSGAYDLRQFLETRSGVPLPR